MPKELDVGVGPKFMKRSGFRIKHFLSDFRTNKLDVGVRNLFMNRRSPSINGPSS
jgi:hypothetical protein